MIFAEFTCAYCDEENEVAVDGESPSGTVMTEDCQVCCRPNLITIRWEEVPGTDPPESQPYLEARADGNLED